MGSDREVAIAAMKNRELDIQWHKMMSDEIMDVQKRMNFLPPKDMVKWWTHSGHNGWLENGQTLAR